ncbi:MAG: phospholipase D-like domain-containing protein, partial [Usitatibacter sp.]
MNFALRSCAALALLILAACNTLPTVDSGGVSRGPLYLEDLDTPLKAGNRVVLLQNGAATYGAMLQAIAGARDSINMESYIFEDDEVGTKFADALVAKQAQGVQVTLIYDSVGSNGSSAEFFKRLRDSGIQVLEFNPINPLAAKGLTYKIGNRDHRKLLIVDGRTAFMGGINISGVYTSGSGSGSGAGSGAPRSNATRQPMP